MSIPFDRQPSFAKYILLGIVSTKIGISWARVTYIFWYPFIVFSPASFELHLQHLLTRTLLEALFEVTLNALPHILAFLVTVSPTRFEYAALLVGACAFEGWRNLLAETILVLTHRVFLGGVSRCAWPFRMTLLHPTTSLKSRSSTGGCSKGAWDT
jgi:hypothetical protein